MMVTDLAIWRAFGPSRLDIDVERRLLAAVQECTDPADFLERGQLTAALRGDNAEAMWAVGCARAKVEAEPSDVTMSWVLLAAMRGHVGAILGLACELVALATDMRHRPYVVRGFEIEAGNGPCTPSRLNRLALEWSRLVGPFLERHDAIAELLAGDRKLELPKKVILPNVDAKRSTPSRDVVLSGATLRVVDQVGDPESREGRPLVASYGHLTSPFSLAAPRARLDVIGTALRMEFPQYETVIGEILADARLMALAGNPWLRLRPILFVGRAGVGKSRLARRIGELAGIGCATLSGAGSDNRALAGTARGWAGVQPSFPILAIKQIGIANPLICIDEIDKVSSRHSVSIYGTLLSLMERETSRRYYDEALLSVCDLSQISWIVTANSLDPIPAPLLSRVRVFDLSKSEPASPDVIIENVLRDIADEFGIASSRLPEIEPAARAKLQKALASGASIRAVRAVIAGYLARSEPTPAIN